MVPFLVGSNDSISVGFLWSWSFCDVLEQGTGLVMWFLVHPISNHHVLAVPRTLQTEHPVYRERLFFFVYSKHQFFMRLTVGSFYYLFCRFVNPYTPTGRTNPQDELETMAPGASSRRAGYGAG